MPRGQGLKQIKINFARVKDMTLGELYGTEPIPISDLNKLLWRLIKKENLRLNKVYSLEEISQSKNTTTTTPQHLQQVKVQEHGV